MNVRLPSVMAPVAAAHDVLAADHDRRGVTTARPRFTGLRCEVVTGYVTGHVRTISGRCRKADPATLWRVNIAGRLLTATAFAKDRILRRRIDVDDNLRGNDP